MALGYVLQQVGVKLGQNPNDSGQRAVLLRFANEAAIELYQMSDMAGCLEEQYFRINANQTIAMPEYVGQIRAMREAYSKIALKLSQLRPRYNQFNWQDGWRNWRLKGLQTLQTSITNQSLITFTVEAVENPPVVVSITGSTAGSSNTTESITMISTSMTTVNAYLDITSFTKDRVNNYNINMLDIDNNPMSYLANNQLKAKFQIVDISDSPWYPFNVNPLLGWVEVLYKKALPWFANDTDEFPAVGYDNVWVNKCLQLWYEEQNNPTSAVAYYNKVQQSLAQIHEDTNRGTDDVVSMVSNPHDEMNPRVGFGRDYRWAWRISGR